MNKKKLQANLILLFTAVIWGSGFIPARVCMEYVSPTFYTTLRFLVASIALLPLIGRQKEWKPYILGGAACGAALMTASLVQQYGLIFTSASKGGFITAMYVVMVPVLSIFLKKKAARQVWFGVVLAVAGLYLLCITSSFSVAPSDILVFISAFFFAVHFLVIDHCLKHAENPFRLAFFQAVTCALIGAALLPVSCVPDKAAFLTILPWFVYSGAIPTGLGFALMIVGQRNTGATISSIILSLESVSAVVFGVLLLDEHLGPRELAGCVLMFAAIVIAQLPSPQKKSSAEEVQCDG